ncbi:hypothetical protein GIB67_022010, partial [Kingdonia uniflora]
DKHGDCPRPLPLIKELNKATDITNRKNVPSWDYEGTHGRSSRYVFLRLCMGCVYYKESSFNCQVSL